MAVNRNTWSSIDGLNPTFLSEIQQNRPLDGPKVVSMVLHTHPRDVENRSPRLSVVVQRSGSVDVDLQPTPILGAKRSRWPAQVSLALPGG